MPQTHPPATVVHLRTARCLQRERPAATLPSRIAIERSFTGAKAARQYAASPAQLFLALLGQEV